MPTGVGMLAPHVYSKLSPGLQQRLLADDAEAFHFLHVLLGVGDDPVPADELGGDVAGVVTVIV